MRKKGLIGKKLLSVITVLAVCGSVLGGCGSSADTAASGTAPADSAAAETGEAGAFDFASVSDVKFPLKEKLNMTVFVYATMMEAVFDAAYLIFDLIAGILFFTMAQGRSLFILYGVLTLTCLLYTSRCV